MVCVARQLQDAGESRLDVDADQQVETVWKWKGRPFRLSEEVAVCDHIANVVDRITEMLGLPHLGRTFRRAPSSCQIYN